MRISLLVFALLTALVLTACGAGTVIHSPDEATAPIAAGERLPTPTPFPEIIGPDVVVLGSAYIPGLSTLLPPDGIRPVYAPSFVNARDADLNPDELVMGVAAEGEAKAYPVTVLRFREMVNDELAGLPILVTW